MIISVGVAENTNKKNVKSNINFIDNKKVIIDGCKSVIDYDENFVTLNLGKNDVKFFESILKDLNATCDNVILFEDSLTSIKNARKNNIECVAVIHNLNRHNKKGLNENSTLVIKNYKNKKLKSLNL